MKFPAFTRFASLLLAALMLLSLAACANAVGEAETTASNETVAETEATTEYVPDIEKKNYDADFNIVIGGTFTPSYIFVEELEENGGQMQSTVYDRSINIKDHLGVQMALQDAGSWTEYAAAIARTVQAGDDDYQMVLTPVYQGVTDLITTNSLYNFDDLEAINLDAPYWNRRLMDDIVVDGQHLYGYNDFCLSYVNLIVFNKDMMTRYNLTAPYDDVRNKKWTLDKLISMASNVAVDNGDNVWDAKDTYGLSGWGWVPLIDFITASDLKIVDLDENDNYVIAYENNTEKMINLIDKIFTMYEAEYSHFWKSVPEAGSTVAFADGTTLFQFFASPSLVSLREEDIKFGVLPYPLYDEKQAEYKTLNWNGLMGVPGSIKNPAMVGEVIELLAYYTSPVKTAFYEDLLGQKIADAPDDAEMLNIIWDTQVTDIGIITCNSSGSMDNLVYMIPKMCENGNNNFASYMKANKKSAQRGLDKVFKQ